MKLLHFVNLVTINLHKSIRHIGRKIKSGNPLSRLGPFNIACNLYEQIKENSHDFWIFKLCGIYIYQYQGLKRSYLASRKKTNNYRESSDTK